ncbi:MAG TPA: acyl-CoA dehydrogenase family protein [Acidimicrobiales bacterium]|nr:acyl-CoA dehydrogenase family protein [Acidimicrobiales bacterium]
MTDFETELKAWLEENWEPDLTVREWWQRLGESGWAAPTWPVEWYGKGLSRAEGVQVSRIIRDFGALGAPGGLGLLLAGPTIATHGSDEQKERYLRDIVTGAKGWCQLFSEPGAGSDLAGLGTRAVRDGDEWAVNGQKVWTSGGQHADLGMLLARTDPDVPKHQGISYFAFDMLQPGVEVRPLREMTGRALFNEVFITDARVRDDACIGGVNNGWAVANTTLAFERAGLGAGGGGESGSAATPGTVSGDLDRRAGDFTGRRVAGEGGAPASVASSQGGFIADLAKHFGKHTDPVVRQGLAKLFTLTEIGRYMTLRIKGGTDIPGAGNIGKLSMSEILRLQRELGLAILGPLGTLHAYGSAQRKALDDATGEPAAALVTEMALFSPGPSIYGGTDQVQKNILGERVLGLPKEPNNDRVTAWKDLPRNG